MPAPANDDFANRIVVTDPDFPLAADNTDATFEVDEPKYFGFDGDCSMWYEFTPPTSGIYRIALTTFSFTHFLAVYTGSAVNALVQVGNYNDPGSFGEIDYQLEAGTAYKIQIAGYTSSDVGAFTIDITYIPPPTNDNFANRTTLVGLNPSATGQTNEGATREADEPTVLDNGNPVNNVNSVWYEWVAPQDGYIRINFANYNYSFVYAVYTGNSLLTLVEVDVNPLYLIVTSGTSYKILVDGYNGNTGDFDIEIEYFVPPVNDDFEDRILISGSSGSLAGTTTDATKQADEPTISNFLAFHSVWYEWVAPANGMLLLDTTGSSLNTCMAIYTGAALASLVEVKNNNVGFDGTDAAMYVNVQAGVSYKIRVDGFSGAQGDFVMAWTLTSICGVTCGTDDADWQVGFIGGVNHFGSPRGIVVDGNYAYIGVNGSTLRGLVIVDISDPENPVEVGSIALNSISGTFYGQPQSVAKNGNYVYVTANWASTSPQTHAALFVVDVSNPASPVLSGLLDYGGASSFIFGFGNSIVADGDYVFVTVLAGATYAVRSINVSNPALPVESDSLPHGGSVLLSGARGLAKQGNYLYVCSTASDAIEVIDASDPTNLTHVTSISDGSGGASIDSPRNCIVHDSIYLMLTSFDDNAIEILNISNPAAPSHVVRFNNVSGASELREPVNLAVCGNYLYVTRSKLSVGNGMSVLNIANPAAPTYCKWLTHNILNGPHIVLPDHIVSDGSYVYYCNSNNSILGGMTIMSRVGSQSCTVGITVDACPYVSGGQVRKMVDTVDGLDHLEGLVIKAQMDGDVPKNDGGREVTNAFTVTSGEITLPKKAAVIHAGIGYEGTIELLKTGDGSETTGQTKMRRIFLAILRIYRTLGLEIGIDADHLDPIFTRDQVALFTGDMEKLPNTSWRDDAHFMIKQRKPLPANILAAITRSEVEEGILV